MLLAACILSWFIAALITIGFLMLRDDEMMKPGTLPLFICCVLYLSYYYFGL